MKQIDTKLAKAIRELQNEVEQKITLLEALRKEYDPEEIDYYKYIQTQAWEETRQKVFRRDGFRCVICNEAKDLNVHHITYENLGAEKVSDLVTLCRDCHEHIHSGQPYEGWTYQCREAIQRKILLLFHMTPADSSQRERLRNILIELEEI
jgi:hypothetical protein